MSTPPNNRGRRVIKVNAMSQARLIYLMLRGTLCCHRLADESGLAYVTVLQYVRELRKAGAAHVHRWDPDTSGKHSIPVTIIGIGVDAKRPPALTVAQRQARYRRKQERLQAQGVVR